MRLVDRIAYINHDIDDAVRAGVITPADLPSGPIAVLGGQRPASDRHARARPRGALRTRRAIVQGEEVGGAMAQLRAFMFERVYLGAEATSEHAKVDLVIRALFEHYCAHPDQIPASIPNGELGRRVADYIAGMTDRFAIAQFEALSVPTAFAP